ncbi:MAG TPA: flagellar motor protein MotB [Sphingomonas sp.]|jgi:hypothetical protein
MTAIAYPDPPAGKPLWLVTLADLALLLVGFFVLLQANQGIDRSALARGLREGFGVVTPDPAPLPVAADGVFDFAPGSAALPRSTGAIAQWASDAARDPRVMLTVTGFVDGTPADVDPATGSAALLAADRARAVAAAIAGATHARIAITTSQTPGRRAALVTLAFAGERKDRL